jgi:hypothetical protein
VTRHGRKRKGKNILLFFLLFVEEDSFLPLEQRVELKIDLAGATTLWKKPRCDVARYCAVFSSY